MAETSMLLFLVDRARKKMSEKHRGGGKKIQLEEAFVFSPPNLKEIVALDDALKRVEEMSQRQAPVVELRFFAEL
jgi:hypothetical protein